MLTIIGVLVALKVANVGEFSWKVPIGLLVLYGIIKAIAGYICRDKTGEDWHDGMFD